MEPSGEITHITSQVAAIDSRICKLYKERAKLFQKLNHIRCPIISRFPSEVLSRIFRFSTHTDHRKPHFSSTKALFTLRAVCSHWHRVVESSPQLWTTLTLGRRWRSRSDEDPVADIQGLVRYYFQRLGGATMSLYISDPYAPLIADALRLVLKDYPGKLRSLHLQNVPNELTEIWPIILEYANSKFTQLEEFELDWGEYTSLREGDTLFCKCPQLKTLSICGNGGREIAFGFPWAQITTLKLNKVHLKYSFRLLSLCPNLVSFASSDGDGFDFSWVPPQRQMVVSMESLRDLTWIHSRPYDRLRAGEKPKPMKPKSPEYQFFVHFRFPAVHKLHWDSPLPSDAPSIRDFFANMQELEELTIRSSECKYRIDQYLNLFGNLTTLTMDITGGTEGMEHWLWRLTIKPGENNLIPRLQRLHLSVYANVSPLMLTLVLYSRRNGPVDWLEPNLRLLPEQQAEDNIVLPPYDPTSTHWHRHARLLEFSTRRAFPYPRKIQLNWTYAHYGALKAMMLEARQVEGFGEGSIDQNRIIF